MSKPVQSYRYGAVSVAIWLNPEPHRRALQRHRAAILQGQRDRRVA